MKAQAALPPFACCILALGLVGAVSSLTAEDAKSDDVKSIAESHRKMELTTVGGAKVRPLAPKPGEYSIVLFTATECPIANAFSPEISRIAAEYAEKKCHLFLVYTDPELDERAIRKHMSEYSLKPAVAILDKEQRLVEATRATHTPEAAVIDASGKMLYRGRVNNRYPALGKKRRIVTSHDLRDALSAIVEGKPVKNPRTEPVGCYIPTPLAE